MCTYAWPWVKTLVQYLGELQNSWDLWLFIYPKCDTLGFDPWLCNATYNHSNGIFVAISNGI